MFVNTSNTEYRVVIKFFTRKRSSAKEITKKLPDANGHSASSYRTVVKWVAEFNDSTRTCAQSTTTTPTDESIRAVEEIVMHDRQISVSCIGDELSSLKTLLLGDEGDFNEMSTKTFHTTSMCQSSRLL